MPQASQQADLGDLDDDDEDNDDEDNDSDSVARPFRLLQHGSSSITRHMSNAAGDSSLPSTSPMMRSADRL